MVQLVLAHCAGGATTWCDLGTGLAFVLVVVAIFWGGKRAERKARERRAALQAAHNALAALAAEQAARAPTEAGGNGEVTGEPAPPRGYRRRSTS